MLPKQTNEYELPSSPEELGGLIERAQSGDRKAIPAVRRMLDFVPELVSQFGGDLVQAAERPLIDAMGGEDLAFKEAVKRKLAMMRAELAGPSPTPLEMLLVDRIVTCWLQVQSADIAAAQTTNCPLELADFQQRRQARAHRRYLSAIKMLATVRKLALPALQLNIGQNQVNVAGEIECLDGRSSEP